MFEIKDLCVSIEEKEILKDFNLSIKEGEIHVLMGPNGAGKSTICKSILNHPNYQITKGSIFYQGKEITHEKTATIAKMGLYYINQTPIEIEGITNLEMLRTALNEQQKELNIFDFKKKCQEVCEKLNIPKSFITRQVNVGMSGGERKKNELLGMWILEPSFLLLDEIDSGLDIDAIKLVGKNLKEYHEKTNASMLIVTHQKNLIDLLNPDYVHVMEHGQMVKTGSKQLAEDILKNGFYEFLEANMISGSGQSE